MKYKIIENSLAVKREGKSRMVQLVLDAFALSDGILRGTLTGGLEAPRIVISAEEMDDDSVIVCWENQSTFGYSDRRYHCRDTGPHEDVYRINAANQLEVNGRLEQFGMDKAPDLVIPLEWPHIESFFKKWKLKESGPSKEERERILEKARIRSTEGA